MVSKASKKKSGIPLVNEFEKKGTLVIRDGKTISIETSEVVVGDLVPLYPGDIIPADGVIVEGEGNVDTGHCC